MWSVLEELMCRQIIDGYSLAPGNFCVMTSSCELHVCSCQARVALLMMSRVSCSLSRQQETL